ncbi:hypothetical protein ALC53_10778 [Atta colombica]|uniref:Uncharacterized protein n=1 Tax=Atta colombica TaxID=520822 RepID=A0A195B3F3_9HYME|nr:hypothetical protein ALC53_10778 [Atta colombica]
MSSRLALPVSGPAHKDRDTYMVAAGTLNAHKNWDTVYVGEKGFYCD